MNEFKCPSLSVADIHNTVQKILTDHWNRKIPVNIDTILDSLGFEVEPIADLNFSYSSSIVSVALPI